LRIPLRARCSGELEPAASIDAKTDELLGLDVVAGASRGNDERRTIEREEKLAAVGVVVGVP